MENSLVKKYNVQAPRYTSYPTVPYWDTVCPTQDQWKKSVEDSFYLLNGKKGISLYIHLPYCESLCTYCGCNTRITKNHKVETPYIISLLNEWALYLAVFPETPHIAEIHLGGGTPTFFSADHLRQLIEGISASSVILPDAAFSFEAHPANTTTLHLQTLYNLGFRRISLGIQDFNPKVQDMINRFQTEEQVRNVTENARKTGYTSINFDLIYGLPLQTRESVNETIDKVIELKPERIAFYAYAHVPWIKPGQRKYDENDLPQQEEKLKLYESGKEKLLAAGYREIGMDHFALEDDELLIAMDNSMLNRNFMGYTTTQSKLMIGLGASSISDSWFGFVQNHKKVEDYQQAVAAGILPFNKGHLLSETDTIIRQHILNLMCRYETNWENPQLQCRELYEGLERLREAESDGLVTTSPFRIKITAKGKPFLRNICMALDAKLHANQPDRKIFSSAI